MIFNKYNYIFPPRPKNCIPPEDLDHWDNNQMLAQPKLNGSNGVLFLSPDKAVMMNRHNGVLTNVKIDIDELKSLYRGNGGWMVINGEYMNKLKNDETNNPFNHKFVIFDILVHDSDYLVGRTFQERVDILDKVYGTNNSDKTYLYGISENIFRVKSFNTGFKDLYNTYTSIDMIEGLVLKRKNARLEIGNTENNNTKSQVKSRKKSKLYKF